MKPLSATRKSKPSLSISTAWGSARARRRTSSASAITAPPKQSLLHAVRLVPGSDITAPVTARTGRARTGDGLIRSRSEPVASREPAGYAEDRPR
ncbi:hypothetical protein Jiend_56020 [Micromonospora endophytica]|nr:hypothetical protein Jiend_56020 [Micromonospora endophytica]